MSKTDWVGRITRLLISGCVVPASLGLSVLHTQAAGMSGLPRNEIPCGDSTGRSGASPVQSECDCPHCSEANSSGSSLLRFFKPRGPKWSSNSPKHSWKCYHPCPPYFEPTFGISQTSWTILPHDVCQTPIATPFIYIDDPSPPATELQPSTLPAPRVSPPEVQTISPPEAAPVAPPEAAPLIEPDAPPHASPEAQPEARHKAMPSRVTPAAAEISADDSRSRIERQAVVPGVRAARKLERTQTSLHQESVSRADSQRQPRHQTGVPAAPRSTRSTKVKPRADVPIPCSPARPDSDAIVPNMAFKFDERTPSSLFTSQTDPLFRTKPAAGSETVSH